MCGINGFSFNNENLIRSMNNIIKHRGPDQDSIFLDDNFSLGHVRLSIIDLSENGRQPMFNEEHSLALVFNGEIYNFLELRKQLEIKGHRFISKTDSEVILHLYEEKGADCLDSLDGIFSFAIYNVKEKSVFMARDHFGVKPLYYYWDGNKLIFSSEIKAILCHEINKEIDKEAFSSYFHLLFSLAPKTIFKNIFKLQPAHYLFFKRGRLEVKSYWRSNLDQVKIIDKAEIKTTINRLTSEAVKKQLVSDRPLGVFLSGGIDSTIITALAKKFTAGQLKTFCVGFETSEEYDKFNVDLLTARRVSKDLGTDHHELMISGKSVLAELEKVAWHMDEPISNHTQVITYLLAKYSKSKVDVVLGGDGGDELFAGYPRYKYNLLLDWYQKIPVSLRRLFVNKIISSLKPDKKYVSEKLEVGVGVGRYLNFLSQKTEELSRILKTDYINDVGYINILEQKYPAAKNYDSNDLLMLMDLENWLPEESLMRSDKTTMAFGLEERVPLLDKNLIEYSLRLPRSYKLNPFDSKIIFKQAMSEYLPDYVLNAPKRGWFSPMAKWLRTDLKDFAYDVLSPGYCAGTSDIFDFDALRKILTNHISKKEYNLTLIWSAVSFQLWYKNFMNK